MKGVERVAVSSNSAATVLASTEPGSAAICGKQCAEMYGLNILERNIEDKKNNTTPQPASLSSGTNVNRLPAPTKESFTVDDRQPGSLVDALSVLKTREINLTKIDSRPSGASPWNYFFFIECMGH
ncbi:UNVERIFIED_CONTAM: prephenate dehydratase [Siphonaria sp. JEL0065]|nr:prephenate dehydratase [Siphonaria sp. JEL0065]